MALLRDAAGSLLRRAGIPQMMQMGGASG